MSNDDLPKDHQFIMEHEVFPFVYEWYREQGFEESEQPYTILDDKQFALGLYAEGVTVITWLKKTDNPDDVFLMLEIGLGNIREENRFEAMKFLLECNVANYSPWKYGVGPQGKVMLTWQFWMNETNPEYVAHLLNHSVQDGKRYRAMLQGKSFIE